MRILLIVHKLGEGGTERAVQNCAMSYADRGHEAAVLSYLRGGRRVEILRGRGIPVFAGGPEPAEVEQATEEAARWGAEIVHLHRPGYANPLTDGILYRLNEANGSRLPVVETNHFSRADRSANRSLIDVHIQLSRWCMWKWQQWARGLRPQPLGVVIPHMVDAEAFRPAAPEARAALRESLAIPPGAFVFGRLARPSEASWSQIVLRAFADLAPAAQDAYLLLVGAPPSIERAAEKLPPAIRERMILRSVIRGDEQLRTCYSSIDCFLHAANAGETFGYVLVEATLCGAAPITLSQPARGNTQVEVVGHMRGGLIVNDRRSMVKAMHRMMDDEPLRRRLVEGGQSWIRSEYGWDVVADRHVRLLELTKEGSSREQLRRCLEQDPAFVTRVDWSEIRELMHGGMGQPSLRNRVLLQLGHQPTLYHAFRRLKELQNRLASRG